MTGVRQKNSWMQRKEKEILSLSSSLDGIMNESNVELLAPSGLFLASAICYIDPSLAPSLLFAMLGFGLLYKDTLAIYLSKPLKQTISNSIRESLDQLLLLTEDDDDDDDEDNKNKNNDSEGDSECMQGIMEEITSTTMISKTALKKNKEDVEKVFQVIARMVSKSFQSKVLVSTIHDSISDLLLNNDELYTTIFQTIQKAMMNASNDEHLKETIHSVGRKMIVGGLKDATMIQDLIHSIVDAIVLASQNEKLRITLLDIITQGMSDALQNEQFVTILRTAVKDTLQDKSLYQASAKGLLAAANPFSSSSSSSSKKS